MTTARLVLCLLTISVTAWGQYAPPPSGLVGWWRGEGNANDSFGGHHGVLKGGMAFTEMFLYIDGTLVAQKVTAATPVLNIEPSGDTGLGIGNSLNFDFPMLGEIDEVVLYSRALSELEVASLVRGTCQPRGATATAQVVNGFVVGAIINDGGCGYTNTPLVIIQGGGGARATATALVGNGVVTGITITDAGIGYTNAPDVIITSPPYLPWLEVEVSAVKVTQHVTLGSNYVLQFSVDLQNWSPVGSPFKAERESSSRNAAWIGPANSFAS